MRQSSESLHFTLHYFLNFLQQLQIFQPTNELLNHNQKPGPYSVTRGASQLGSRDPAPSRQWWITEIRCNSSSLHTHTSPLLHSTLTTHCMHPHTCIYRYPFLYTII